MKPSLRAKLNFSRALILCIILHLYLYVSYLVAGTVACSLYCVIRILLIMGVRIRILSTVGLSRRGSVDAR